MTNSEAIRLTLEQTRRDRDVDPALATALESIALVLDSGSRNSQLWKVYLEAIERLTSGASDGTTEDLLAELSGNLRNPAPAR